MLQLVEMEGKMTENGCIEIPAVVLEQAGICTGDTVKLVYMAEDGELKNTAKEFLLARAGQDVAEELAKEENIAFQIPEELLRDAGIPMDADLDIVCQEGRIIILPSELVQGTKVPEELLAIAGVDPLDEETYQRALDFFGGLVDEYERLVDAKLEAE